jgi:hypothetical protein
MPGLELSLPWRIHSSCIFGRIIGDVRDPTQETSLRRNLLGKGIQCHSTFSPAWGEIVEHKLFQGEW